jgi:hypothetical protein
MGAVLGIAAFGRTQEKIAGTAVNPAPVITPTPIPTPAPSFGSPVPMAKPTGITTNFPAL